MGELIDRQAAIEAIEQMQMPIMRSEFPEEQFVFTGMSEALQAIKDLPSAPPQKVCVAEVKVGIDDLKDYIDKAINAERWIPCSERLPEDIKPVLITWKNTDPASYYQYIVGKHFIGSGHFCNGKWFWYSSTCEDYLAEYGRCDVDEIDEAIEVIAWMPLPEPYKEGE